MKKKQLLSSALNHPLIKCLFQIPRQTRIVHLASVLVIFILGTFTSSQIQAQTVKFDAFTDAAYDGGVKGYVQAGVGTYFRSTNPGTITIGQGNACFGDPSSGTTGSSTFIFFPTISNISKITVNGTGTGSNRTFASLSTSTTLAGTYTPDAGAVGTGIINSGTCGSIDIVPSATISSGTYMQFKFSGNLNITSIVFLNNASTPLVATTSVTPGYTTASVTGNLVNDGGFSGVTRGFVYSATNPNPTLADNLGVITDPAQVLGSYTAEIPSLSTNTTYYVSAYATNTLGTTYGNVLPFTTKTPGIPTITTTAISSLTSFGANTGGNITDDGGSPITARGVVWSTSPNPTIPSANSTSNGTGDGAFVSNIIGLNATTLYYVRAYATNGSGTSYGDELSFTTDVPQPSLVSSVTSLTFPSTTIGSNLSLTYTLTGSTLTPDGTITFTVPDGYTVSPASITYTGTEFTQIVTVTFAPTEFKSYSGVITPSGGGATGLYVVSTNVSGEGKLPTPALSSNAGNDFWLGFGYQKDMNASSQRVYLALYIAAGDDDAQVVVDMPGIPGFVPYETTVAANTVTPVDPSVFGTLGFLDVTGISAKGIHVFSKNGKTISVWMHTYSRDNSAAGSLLFPTNTWNNSYYVQSSGGKVNNGYFGNSYFFVIAKEDNTVVTIKPSNPIILPTSSFKDNMTAADIYKNKDEEFTVTLNKGEVFNGIGYIDGSTDADEAGLGALDLTGTKVSTTCDKQIAVFGGDGRLGMTDVPGCTASSPTSDHLVQQMLPSVAWGTKYLTVPTKTMEFNLFRIIVQDPATVVKLNNNILPSSGLINNLYYSIANDSLNLIEADKPISVAQYILDRGCSYLSPNNGISADPEMIILSPVQQGIRKVTVYSATFQSTANEPSTGGSFINVVMKKEGISSFLIDGLRGADLVDTGVVSSSPYPDVTDASSFSSVTDAFQPHPYDNNYVWAKFRVATGVSHTLFSAEPFNAIAYGTRGGAAGESYGYNAGTIINDLTAPLIINNPYGDSLNSFNYTAVPTCRGNDVSLSATLPYANLDGHDIIFDYGNNSNVSPSANDTIKNPVLDHSFEHNGQTFYVYKLSQKHVFNANGDYAVNITYFNPSNDGACGIGGSNKTISYTIRVTDGIIPDFSIAFNDCINDSVILTDQSNGLGFPVTEWIWSYKNGSKPLPDGQDIVQNPRIKNPADNVPEKNYTLRAINEIGCYKDITKDLPITTKPTVTLPDLAPVCADVAAYQLPAGSPAGGVYKGNGVTASGLFTPSQAGVGTHAIKYVFVAESGCGDSTSKDIVVSPTTDLSINTVDRLCVTGEPVTLVGNPSGGTFSTDGPGLNGNVFSPSVAGIGAHTITYSVSGNCAAPVDTVLTVNDKPQVYAGPDLETTARTAKAFDEATASEGSTYLWSPADGLSDPTVLHPVATRSSKGEYIYTLTANNGCEASDEMKLTVKGPCVDPPLAFTPNGDGQHDYWVMYSNRCFSQLKVDVFNRWGSRVYHSDDYDNKWEGKWVNDGTGRLLPDGTYYYVIIETDPDGTVKRFTGNVTIIR